MKKLLKVLFGRVVLCVLCILAQVAWLCTVISKLNEYYAAYAGIVTVVAVIAVIIINAQNMNPAYKMVWAVVILVLPVFGIFLYLLIGRSGLNRKHERRLERINQRFSPYLEQDGKLLLQMKDEDKRVGNLSEYITNYSTYPMSSNTDVKYYKLADEALEDLKAELRAAEHFIFMEYFAVEDGQVFQEIEEILVEKVKQGVEVRFIYDDFGSIGYVTPKFMKRLNDEGIQCRMFNPLVPFVMIIMNNRDHRKITVIDNKVSFSGGFNLADEYFNVTHPYGHWKDTGIKMTGDGVQNHLVMFLEMWNFIADTDGDASTDPESPAAFEKYFRKSEYRALEQNTYVHPYSDTPLDHECLGENVYANIINSAKDYVYIYTPYLIIDNEMMEYLTLAAKRGVDVRIVTPGIPDKKLIFKLTQSYYPPLLEAGVRIYEYTPGFIHAKCFLSDDTVGTVGTINLDYRSLYLHFESATLLYQGSVLEDMKADFADTFVRSTEIPIREGHHRALTMLQCVMRLFAPLL